MPEFPVQEFLTQQDQDLAAKIQTYQPQGNTASSIGHQCERYLVYKRTRGKEAAPHSTHLQALFDEGKVQELEAIRLIRERGWLYERGQEWMEWKDLQLRGKMEGVVLRSDNGRVKWAAEIKKASDFAFDKINTWHDLVGGSTWHYRWLVQLQIAIYHVASREGYDDAGVLLLKNEGKSLIKPISVPMNMDILNGAFEKCKRINAHIKANTLPDRLEWTAGLCRGTTGRTCDFYHMCNPEECLKAGQRFTSPEFISLLERRESLDAPRLEYARIDRDVKAKLRGVPNAVAGAFKIEGTGDDNKWSTKIVRVMSSQDAETIKPLTEPDPEPAAPPLVDQFLKDIEDAKTLQAMDAIKTRAKVSRDAGHLTGSTKDKVAQAFAAKRKKLTAEKGGTA